jgi:glutathione S-transferase
VQTQLIDPNLATALAFMEAHLSHNTWFTGEHLAMADFQMSFAVEAALLRSGDVSAYPHVAAYKERINARPAYQRAIAQGGPVLMKPAA